MKKEKEMSFLNAKENYEEKGWVVVNEVFSIDEVDQILNVAMSLTEKTEVENITSEINEDGVAIAPRKIHQPFLLHSLFSEMSKNKRLNELIQVLVGKECLLGSDQVFMKPPYHGSEKPYHQDNAYFRSNPPSDIITAWIALDDATEENGCLSYIDGSHKKGLLDHHSLEGQPYHLSPLPEYIDLNQRSYACVKKGGVVFHHSEALHGSGPNLSRYWRRAWATHWVSTEAQCSEEFLQDSYLNLKV